MKKRSIITLLAVGIFPLSLLGLDQDPQLETARNHLNAKELIQARDAFATVTSQHPENQKAHAMLAITSLASLYADPRVNALLDTWEVDADGRDIYDWTAGLPEDDSNLPPPGTTSGQMQEFIVDVLLSEIVIAGEHLSHVTDPGFGLRLKPENFGEEPDPWDDELVIVDFADVLVIRSGLKAAEFILRLGIASNNLDVSINALLELADDGFLTAERVLNDYPALLTLKDGQERVSANEALTNAINFYYQASPLLRDSGRDDRLFVLDPEDWADEEEFVQMLGTLEEALEGPVDVSDDEEPPFFVDLSPLTTVDGVDLRTLLPTFSNDRAVEGTLPDPTFGGITLNFTMEDAENWLFRNNLLLTWKPAIFAHASNQLAERGTSITLFTEADAAAPFEYQWMKNGVDIGEANEPTLVFEDLDGSDAGYYSVKVWNEFGDDVSPETELLVTIPLAEALDAPELAWTSTGHGWIGQTLNSHDGIDAVQTAPANDFVTGWLSTTVSGPGTVSFWWKLETLYGWGGDITFYRNGAWQTRFDNAPGWRHETFDIPEGTHTLQWEYYTTDGSRGWIDEFTFSPSGSSSESFAEWAEALPADQRGESDDPGGYGIPNLLRYAFDMDPIQPDLSRLPQVNRELVWIDDEPETQLSLTFTRRKDNPDLQYTVEVSDNVLRWDPLHVAQQVIDDGNGVTETVIIRDPQTIGSQDKRFLRVRVHQ